MKHKGGTNSTQTPRGEEGKKREELKEESHVSIYTGNIHVFKQTADALGYGFLLLNLGFRFEVWVSNQGGSERPLLFLFS